MGILISERRKLIVITSTAILFLGCIAPAVVLGAPAKTPYKIGVCLALTGPLASLGDPELKGAKLAAEIINARGGIQGHPVELIIEDDGAKPEQSVTKAIKLITKDEVLGLFGGTTGDNTMAIAPIAEKRRVTFMSPTGSTGEGIERQYKYTFLCLPDDHSAEPLVQYSVQVLNCRRLGLLRLTRLWGVKASRSLHRTKDKFGIEIVREETAMDADKDFTPQLTNIMAANPCAICIWLSGPAAQLAIKNARQLGITLPLIGNFTFASKKTPEIAGTAAEGIVGAATMVWTDPLPRQKEYVERFRQKYNEPPDMWDAMGYDAVMLFAKAIQSLPEERVNKENIRDALENIPVHEGVGGIYNFKLSKDHWPLDESWLIISIKDGKFYRLPFKR